MDDQDGRGARLTRRLARALADRDDVTVRRSPDAADGPGPAVDGRLAFAVATPSGVDLAEVYEHPDRARLSVAAAPEVAAEAAADADLRVRPKAVRPPRTLVFVESESDVSPAAAVVDAVAEAAGTDRA